MKRQIILFILMMAVTIPSLAQMVTGKVLDDLDDNPGRGGSADNQQNVLASTAPVIPEMLKGRNKI